MIEFNENFDFAQSIYIEIKKIINESNFIFNKNKDELNEIKRDNGEPKDNPITFEKLRELRTKIQIKQEVKKDSKDEEISDNYKRRYEELKFFKDLIVNIEEIHDLMNSTTAKQYKKNGQF